MSRAFGEKRVRCRKPAQFIVAWAKRHLPKRLHDASIREMAAHYLVTDSSIRIWARVGVPPMHGGYPRGALSRERRARQRVRKKPQRAAQPVASQPQPIPPEVRLERMRAAFIAELRERLDPRQRLNRIFLAEIRV